MKTFKKLLFLLNTHERKRAGLLIIMIMIMALLDVIGIASVLPFVAVLTNPGFIETNAILNIMFQASSIFGVKNDKEFLFILGTLVFVLLIISLTFKVFTIYAQVRFISMREYNISKRLLEGYLHQSYSWFLSRNSADLGKNILSEVSQVIVNGMYPLIELISKGFVAIALIILIIIVDPKLALIVGVSLSGCYVSFFYFIRTFLVRIGKESLINNKLRFAAINQAFGAAKEIKVGGLEQYYIKLFLNPAQIFAKAQAASQVISQLPRFILEAIALGGMMLIILFLVAQSGSFNNALPIISLYALTGYRLIPSFQQIYASFTQITFVGPSLDKLYEDIKNLKLLYKNQDQDILPLNKTIALKNVYYDYPNTPRTTLNDINLIIPAKSTVGLVGATGSGKTTTVDIILGLLEPRKGTLEVDGKVITKQNLRSWLRSIGYVPQHIYLSDDTVSANIAIGVDPKDINQDMVEKAAKIVNLHEFVINELPKKYQTTIGESGVRLSGGQRQLIGIARALYHNPQVLILDEATSALDNQTEKVVMDAVNNMSKDITIILIAHRLNTVKNCDIILKLDKGQIVAKGTFDELISSSKSFSTI
jgi:ABC-type multidrug transport system fused ATPase/permease subunit